MVRHPSESVDVETALSWYKEQPKKEIIVISPSSRLNRNLNLYWENLIELRWPYVIKKVKYAYWFKNLSLFAILDKMGETKDNSIFTYMGYDA